MFATILPTKLYIPSPHPGMAPRARLLDRLDAGLVAGRQLSLIVAPAGSGKTTLITSWLYSAHRPIARHAVAWLSLDEDDNDPARLVMHMVAALQQIETRIGRGIQDLLAAPRIPPMKDLVTGLISDLAGINTPFVLILDDYHLIEAGEVHDAFTFLLDHQPARMHLVIGTREDPPLPLARLRVRGQVTEIRAPDLAFTAEEVADFMAQSLGQRLPVEQIEGIATRTEGWAAGLQLLALAMQPGTRTGAPTPLADGEIQRLLDSGYQYIGEYLISEVLAQQPDPMQQFLRRTSVLSRLTAPLCDALTGRTNSDQVLRELEAANLFTTRLDDHSAWYRYHRLFADVLRGMLDAETQAELHQEAMVWYQDNAMPKPAMDHALKLGRLTGDLREAARLIKATAEDIAWNGEVLTVQGWLDALPDAEIRRDGTLATLKGWILAMAGRLPEAGSYASAAEEAFAQATRSGDGGEPVTLGKLRCLRSFITVLLDRSYETAITLADDALARLGGSSASGEGDGPHTQWRVLALWSKAESLERLNRIEATTETLREARHLGRLLGRSLFGVVAEGGLIKLLNDRGRRRDALAACEDTLRHYADDEGPLPLASFIYSQRGGLHLEGNDLEAARQDHEQAAVLSRQLGLSYEGIYTRALSAPTLHALGETQAALEALREGYQHASQKGYADTAWFLAWEARIHLEQGDFVFARHWAQQSGFSSQTTTGLLHIEPHLVHARVLISQRRMAEARAWLAHLEAFTRTHGLFRWQITALLLQAEVADRLGDKGSARDLLTQALRTAAPEGYVRAFLTEDPRLIALLPEVRDAAPAFVDRLLEAAGEGREEQRAIIARTAPPQIEPLTDRERDVLRLIAAGRSNQEIAGDLVVAVSTVKRHINNIYGKLQVSRRTEAVAHARELGII